MSRVIAVQEEQLNKLKENYSKNVTVKDVVVANNANMISESLNIPSMEVQTSAPIDMEVQAVNLNSQSFGNDQPVTNSDVTNEVFGSQSVNAVSSVIPEQSVTDNSFNQLSVPSLTGEIASNPLEVPYQEPTINSTVPLNVMSDESFYELLNSLRNMITDFANNAYAKIDKFQEERLQSKDTGANLIGGNEPELIKEESSNEISTFNSLDQTPVVGNNVTNIFDNQLSSDLDKTMVIPSSVITSAVAEVENEKRMVA